MAGEDAMTFDGALDAILAFEVLWHARRGRVRLLDLGVVPLRLVRSRGRRTSSRTLARVPWRPRRAPRARARLAPTRSDAVLVAPAVRSRSLPRRRASSSTTPRRECWRPAR